MNELTFFDEMYVSIRRREIEAKPLDQRSQACFFNNYYIASLIQTRWSAEGDHDLV